MIVTASAKVVAGKRRIAAYLRTHHAPVVIKEMRHFAMLPFLRVARDDAGKLPLTATTNADAEGWDLIA